MKLIWDLFLFPNISIQCYKFPSQHCFSCIFTIVLYFHYSAVLSIFFQVLGDFSVIFLLLIASLIPLVVRLHDFNSFNLLGFVLKTRIRNTFVNFPWAPEKNVIFYYVGRVFYKSLLDLLADAIAHFFYIPVDFLSGGEKGMLKSPAVTAGRSISISPSSFVSLYFIYFAALLSGAYAWRISIYSWCVVPFINI